jgi:Sec-independent protein translocase protein TatA
MLGIGPQELVILGVVLLCLAVFGSGRVSSVARDLGNLLGGARRTVEDVKSELIPDEVNEAHRAIREFQADVVHGTERDKRRHKP